MIQLFTVGTNGTESIVTMMLMLLRQYVLLLMVQQDELVTVTLNSSGGITLDADGGTITFADAGSSLGTITSSGYTGNVVGNVTGNCSGTAATVTGASHSNITTVSNVTTVGALDGGSITSTFGSINNGSSAITTPGTIVWKFSRWCYCNN